MLSLQAAFQRVAKDRPLLALELASAAPLLAIGDAPYQLPAPEAVVTPHVQVRSSVEAVSPDVPGAPSGPAKGHFDNFSHSSGNQRAFTYCCLHDRCRLYIFLKNFESHEHAIAYLFAWRKLGRMFGGVFQGQDHIQRKPTDAEVQVAYTEQFG